MKATPRRRSAPGDGAGAAPPGPPAPRPSESPWAAWAAGSATGQLQPPERMLDRRLVSASTFVSSGVDGGSSVGTQGLDEPQWSRSMPPALLFPGNKPTSRADAVMLDRWIADSLASYAERTGSREETGEEDLSMAVEELVPILSIGLHEIVRQVTQHCIERGVVLEKIWRTYVELFERSLKETRAALQKHKDRTSKVEADLANTEEELRAMQMKHPEQLRKLSTTLSRKFGQRQEELQEQLGSLLGENNQLQEHLDGQAASLKTWFPNFDAYRNCSYRRSMWNRPKVPPNTKAPEAALTADYMRILNAMPPDSRRRVGFFVSSLLGLRSSLVTADSVEGLVERRDHNKWKIEQLEGRLQKLREGGVGRTSTEPAGAQQEAPAS